jgi:transcriptional regulator with GAF, ATPase, and Fis domain
VCTLAEAERAYISDVVESTNGLIAGKGGAAEVLGMPPSTLRNRMKKLGIKSKYRS